MKITALFVCCIITVKLQAQIEMAGTANWQPVGEVKSLGSTKAKLQYHVAETDTTYFLLLKDFTRQEDIHYFSITFKNTQQAFGKLYTLLLSFFNRENRENSNYMQTFRLGDTPVNLQHCTLIGRHGVRLTTREGFINLSEKEIRKLFGMD